MRSLEGYRDLIARVEQLAQASPARYRLNLVLLAGLGFGYVLVVATGAALSSLAVLALILYSKNVYLFKVALLPLGLAYLLVRALFVKLPPPEGRRLTRAEAPLLFDEIERVRKAVNAKPVHAVVLTPEFNAAVTQIPRLGLLGWHRRYLILGFPLLASLPPYQFRAVLAHEFGHLAANHARFGNWIYRVRQTWYQLLQALETNGSAATRLFVRFFNWYTPYFNAYSFVLARSNEYEADRESARVTSPEDAGDALVAVYAKGEYLDSSFWRSFYQRADDQPEPPTQPFTEYLSGLRNIAPEAGERALAAVLAHATGLEDTHPSLALRLDALGIKPRPPACFGLSAAHALLGDARQRLTAEFDVAWHESLATAWKDRHTFMQSMKEKLGMYQAAAHSRELDTQEQWDYANALEAVQGGNAALPVLDALLARDPQHAPGYYARGRILLEAHDERGAVDIERAMTLDEDAKEPGAQLLYGYFYARHEFARCDRYRSTLEDVQRERALASRERGELKKKDLIEPHALDNGTMAVLREVLAGQKGLKRAWLARKRVQYLQKLPAFVLVVEYGMFTSVNDERLARLAEQLSAGQTCLVIVKGKHASARRVVALPGSLIYSA